MDHDLINEDLAPVAKQQKTWTAFNIAALWIGMAICIPTYTLASGLVEQGFSWQAAVTAIILGNIIVLIPMLLNAHAGTRYGIPFPVLLRSSFGIYGANIPALMRALVACGWFGIQTWVGGFALHKLFLVMVPNAPTLPPLLPEFVGITTGQFAAFMAFWLLNVAIIYRGIDSIRILETWSAPFLLATGVALLWWAFKSAPSLDALFRNQAPPTKSFFSAIFGVGLTCGVAYWGTLALNIPDFARFARTQKDQILGQSIGLVPTMAFYSTVGALVTNATLLVFGTRIADPVALIAQIGGPITTAIAMLGVMVATLTTNLAANIVSPANDISNLCPRKISFRTGAMIAATMGVIIMPWKLYLNAADYLFTWMIGYGSMLGSVAGIMIVDYFFIKEMQLVVEELYQKHGRYRFNNGVNWYAVIAMIMGIAPTIPGFLMVLGAISSQELFVAIYERGWFASFFISGVSHFIFERKRAKSYAMLDAIGKKL